MVQSYVDLFAAFNPRSVDFLDGQILVGLQNGTIKVFKHASNVFKQITTELIGSLGATKTIFSYLTEQEQLVI